jgi:hypothetical protein
LHDGLQFGGGELSIRLRRAGHGPDRRCDHHQQRQRQRVVFDELLDAATRLPDKLRAHIAVAMSLRRRVAA